MKKIFAILLSLLFVVSTFGVASVMAPPPPCECQIIGPASVQVGDTFQVVLKTNGGCCFSFDFGNPLVKLIDSNHIPDANIYTFRVLASGNFLIGACGTDCNNFEYYVTVTPKDYPMDQFMKILEKNKNKE